MENARNEHVFISYVREDKEAVDRVQRLLEAAGVPVWRDTESLWPGEDWRIKIRQAITANALVFVACFSDNSERKASTYQREELLLAIEQLRLRAPERPWLIPVRLSDCTLPQYDLGGGRTLDSLHRVDLYGDAWELGAARLVAGVLRILGADEVASAMVTGAGVDPEIFIKRALLDPTRQIELDDYVMAQANVTAETCADEEVFPTDAAALSNEHDAQRFLVAQANHYWDVLDPLLRSLVTGCAWGQAHHEGIWTRAVTRVANAASEHVGGKTVLVDLRRLPVIFLLYGSALSALHRKNFGAIRAVAYEAAYRGETGSVPLVGAAHVWKPFYVEITAHLLALSAVGQELSDDVIDAVRTRRGGRRYTPVSDYLHDSLRPRFRALIPDDADFTSTFDRLEILLGAIAVDVRAQASPTVYVPGPWFGSFTWRDRHADSTLEARMLEELQKQGPTSPLLAAGLFGGSLERAESAFGAFIEESARARSERW